MPRENTTILIGNGLGMAIDPDHFLIQSGLRSAWEIINDETQRRIKTLITQNADLDNEEQLDAHYQVIQACLMLSRIEQHNQKLNWLDPLARTFPDNFRSFVVNVSRHFFDYKLLDKTKQTGLDRFIDRLKKYILDTQKTHVVTLNYDKLIYDRLSVDREIMFFDKAKLIDGFLVQTTGFTPSMLRESDNCGYYLHLHGSPLF